VKVRGYRIELGEIEAALQSHPQVREAVVLARQDAPSAKRLVGYVVGGAGGGLSGEELRGYLKERLPEYMVPAAFVALESLPLTANGKVDRTRLPAPERRMTGAAYQTPRTDLERTLASIWCDVLGVKRVGLSDNFFDLGGDSLSLMRVESELRLRFGRTIPIVELFRQPTLGELAVYLSGETQIMPTFDRLRDRAEHQKRALGTLETRRSRRRRSPITDENNS
jgi:acyl carrier protein